MKNWDKYIWVTNNIINKEAKVDIKTFLAKTSCLEALRAQWTFKFSFYPVSIEEYKMNLMLWDYLNKNRNVLNKNYKVFNIGYPKSLYYFLKHSNRNKVMNPVILGIAAYYVLKIEKRQILKKQIYPPLFDKAMEIVNKYFSHLMNYDEDYSDDHEYEAGYFRRYWQNVSESFDLAFREYVGNSAIFPFINPIESERRYGEVINQKNEFDINLPFAYLKNDDWENIVINGKQDSMIRAESSTELLQNWKRDLNKHYPIDDLRNI